MLTVWAMCTGDAYNPEEVRVLHRQVKQNLSEPHIFDCITDKDINGVFTTKPPNDLPGFWGKVNLFSAYISRPRNLWLDLDVVITGSLDPLVSPIIDSDLRIAKNWAHSGHGGCQSSVMYWEGVRPRIIADAFDRSIACWPPRTDRFWDNGQVQYGDQEWITYLRDTGQLEVEYFNPAHVKSYKYHLRQGLTPDCRVAVFHGRPNPDEVADEWVKECRK